MKQTVWAFRGSDRPGAVRLALLAGLLSLSILSLIYASARLLGEIRVARDADYYLRMAYNFYKYGTFSMDEDDRKNPTPTASREPGFPTYLALSMAVDPRIGRQGRLTLDELRQDGELVGRLKYWQLPILVALGLGAAYIVLIETRNVLLAWLAFLMTGLSPSLIRTSGTLYSEALAALLALGASILLYRIFKGGGVASYVVLGLTLGALTLTRAQFAYLIVFILAVLLYGAHRGVLVGGKALVAGMLSLVLVYSTIVGGWMLRNYLHFRVPTVSARGAIVLMVRAEYNLMTAREFMGSFVYLAFGGALFHYSDRAKHSERVGIIDYINAVRVRLIDSLDAGLALKEGASLGRLNSENESSFVTVAYAEYDRIAGKYAAGANSELVFEREGLKLAVQKILARPVRHLVTSVPLAWRGLFFELPLRSGSIAPELISALLMVISLAYFPALFFMGSAGLKRGDLAVFAFCLPALYVFAFNALLTHGLPRYNVPLVPILVASFLFAARDILTKGGVSAT